MESFKYKALHEQFEYLRQINSRTTQIALSKEHIHTLIGSECDYLFHRLQIAHSMWFGVRLSYGNNPQIHYQVLRSHLLKYTKRQGSQSYQNMSSRQGSQSCRRASPSYNNSQSSSDEWQWEELQDIITEHSHHNSRSEADEMLPHPRVPSLNQIQMSGNDTEFKFDLYNDNEIGLRRIRDFLIPNIVDEDTQSSDGVIRMAECMCIRDLRTAIDLQRLTSHSPEILDYWMNRGLFSKAKSSLC